MTTRRKGAFELEEVIETGKTIPVDARQLVRSKEEMLDAGSFTNGYNGMFTSERTEGKIWMLMDKDNPTLETSWKVIGPYDDSALDARVTALEQGSGGESGPVDWSDVQNKPSFASVATSGSYNDLADRPVLPAPYDDSALSGRVSALENAGFLTEHQDISGKANTADLATVATSGSYNDLSDQPTIPEAYDDTALVARVTALENAPAPVTSYNDLTDKPDLSVYLTEHQDISGKANTADLATVATSGSYNDLEDKPTIPEAYDDTALAGRVTAVESSVSALTADAPAALDTLKEIADWIAADETGTAALVGRVSALEAAQITVDDAMSDTSENPVQNKVVLGAIGDAIDVVETAIAALDTRVTAIETALDLTALTDEEIAALVPA